jgi:hypothetical protein
LGKWPYGSGEEAKSFLAGWGEEEGEGESEREDEQSSVYGHWHAPLPSKPLLFFFMLVTTGKRRERPREKQRYFLRFRPAGVIIPPP